MRRHVLIPFDHLDNDLFGRSVSPRCDRCTDQLFRLSGDLNVHGVLTSRCGICRPLFHSSIFGRINRRLRRFQPGRLPFDGVLSMAWRVAGVQAKPFPFSRIHARPSHDLLGTEDGLLTPMQRAWPRTSFGTPTRLPMRAGGPPKIDSCHDVFKKTPAFALV